MAGFTITRRGIGADHSYGRGVQGLLLPSGGDDTAAINAAVAASRPLGPGTFRVSGVIAPPANAVMRGAGSQQTVLLATAAGAAVRFGPALGTGPQSQYGFHGGFAMDGNNATAGGSGPLILFNATAGTFADIVARVSAGDGAIVAGQNCNFFSLRSGGNAGDGLALDNGCGGNNFYGTWNLFNGGYHLSFRETVAPPAGTYSVPTLNNFYGGLLEQTLDGTATGANLGCVHHLAGKYNYLSGMTLYTNRNVPLVYLEPNSAVGRGTDENDRLYFDNCNFTSAGSAAISSSSAAMTGDIAVVVGSGNVFSGVGANAITWSNAMPVQVDGKYVLLSGTTNLYSPSGSAPKAPTSGLVYANLTLGTNVSAVGGYATPGVAIQNGMLVFQGNVGSTAALGQFAVIATLPAGFWPSVTRGPNSIAGTAPMNLQVTSGGNVLLNTAGVATSTTIYLDGLQVPL